MTCNEFTDNKSTAAEEDEITPDTEAWKQLAEHRETLEMVVEEDVPFAEDAEKLLARLEEEGY